MYRCRQVVGLVCLGLVAVVVTAAPAQEKSAKVRLRLPAANAELAIDGQVIKGEGLERQVTIDKDKVSITATWRPNGYTRISRTFKATVKDGGTIDLSKADDQQPDKIEVIYVPTPQDVVEAMCKLAMVAPEDVVFDLGCGDGRIVLTAVGQFKAKRGVGVDIDKERVKDSQGSAKKQGLEKVVEFRQGDVLDIKDLSDASVVMLYMGEDINLRLKPILQKTLKPGARVVSHRFTMGDWKPVETKSVSSSEGFECEIHLWIVGK